MKDMKKDMENYPSNSLTTVEDKVENAEKVISGKARRKKGSATKRFFDMLIKDDLKTIRDYVVWDVWVPTVKDALWQGSIGAVNAIFGRTTGAGWTGVYDSKSRTDYVAFSKGGHNRFRSTNDRMADRDRGRALYGCDEIILDTLQEAEMILDALNETVQDVGVVTVADYYHMAGTSSEYTDNKYGWSDTIPRRITRLREGGYSIVLPKPRVLD